MIPLGYDVHLPGKYTISAPQITGFDSLTHIFLLDIAQDTLQDLGIDSVYMFNIQPADKGGRFYIKFKVEGTGIANNSTSIADTKHCSIYANNKTVYVNYFDPQNQPCHLYVYNIQGKAILQDQYINNGTSKFNINQTSGCYIIKTISNNSVKVQKVYID